MIPDSMYDENDAAMIRNPVLPGFFPDPSICRVGRDFYLVNSSFAYFPGLPISHSRDLIHWQQIGNALDRPEQLPLDGAGTSRGLFAPTIRYHAGVFFIICTNIDNGGNFIVTARNPAGPWSNPFWLPSAQGIDPSLFFDDDGSVWYAGTRPVPEGPRYSGNWEIWVQRFNIAAILNTADSTRSISGNPLEGEPLGVWRGVFRNSVWPEGPHIYRKGEYYYLFHAEGGTGSDHAVMVARAKTITGPWEGNPANPLLTHRHLGRNAAIVNVGHGDLFDDPEGNWWLALLASRPYGTDGMRFSNLGRETFLVPVIWEDDWPVASPGSGMVETWYPSPLPAAPFLPLAACEHFDGERLPCHWLCLRTPDRNVPEKKSFTLTERPGFLRLYLLPASLRELKPVCFIGRRQQHRNWMISASVEFTPENESECAGIALMQSENFQYRLEICLTSKSAPELAVRLIRAAGMKDELLVQKTLPSGFPNRNRCILAAFAEGQRLTFLFGHTADHLSVLVANVDASILSTERAGGFVGTVLGVFATSNGIVSKNYADIDWFEYQVL